MTGEAQRMQVADLLRIKDLSEAQLKQKTKHEDESRLLRRMELESLDTNRKALQTLNAAEIGLRIKQLESMDAYRKDSLSLDSQRIQHQINVLKSLDAYRGEQIGLESQRLTNEEAKVQLGAARLVFDKEIATMQERASNARASANEELAEKYGAEADRMTKVNKIIDLFIAGNKDPMVQEIARDALGLGDGKTEKRMLIKNKMDARLGILENKDNKQVAQTYIDTLNEIDPEATTMWYFSEGLLDDEAKSVRLPTYNGKQLKVEDILHTKEKNPDLSIQQILKVVGALK